MRARNDKVIQAVIDNDILLLNSKLKDSKDNYSSPIMSIPKKSYIKFKEMPLESISEILLPLNNVTLLHIAALFDSLESFIILERNGFKLDCRTADEYQPLHYACMLGALEVASYILSRNPSLAKIEIKSNSSDNPIKKVIKMRNVVCLKELLKGEKAAKSIVSETPIMIAIKNNQPEAVRLLIDAECALSLACFNHVDNKEEFIQYLLDKIIEVDIPSNVKGKSAVHWLCMSHSKAIAEMILRRGIDVNRFDDKGYPGPFYLVDSVPTKVAIEILDLLVENGYKINSFSRNPPGMTILGYFLQGIQRDPVVIEWLLQHGADPTIKCSNGKRPIDLTKKRDIINLLNKYIV